MSSEYSEAQGGDTIEKPDKGKQVEMRKFTESSALLIQPAIPPTIPPTISPQQKPPSPPPPFHERSYDNTNERVANWRDLNWRTTRGQSSW